MSQVPGLGHVTSYFHFTLFHSPLVGVDKETLATCTLSFTREVRRRNELWQLDAMTMTGAILVSTVLKKAEKGTRVPHICSLCFSKAGRAKLLVKSSETF